MHHGLLLAGCLAGADAAAWLIPPTQLGWRQSPAAPVSADCGPFRHACIPLGARRADATRSGGVRRAKAPTAVASGMTSASDDAKWQHVRQVLRSVYDDDGKFWDYRALAIAEVRGQFELAVLRG
jgi:hypothetical protein